MMPAVPLLTLILLAAPAPAAPAGDVPRPQAISVAVLPVVAHDERNGPLADLLADQVVAELRTHNIFERIVTPAEISLLIGNEHKRQLVNCANDHCALVDQELSGALGVTHLVVGNVAAVNKTVIFNLKLVDLRRLQEVASILRQADAGNEDSLFAVVPGMVPDMLVKASLMKAAKVATAPVAAAPEAGVPVSRMGVLGGGALAVAGGVAAVLALAVVAAGAGMLTVLVAPAVRDTTNIPVPTLIPGGALWGPLRTASLAAVGVGALGALAGGVVGAGGVALAVLVGAVGAL